MLERDGLERLASSCVRQDEDGEPVLLDPGAELVEHVPDIGGVARSEEVCDVVDDDDIDAVVDCRLEDVWQQVAV